MFLKATKKCKERQARLNTCSFWSNTEKNKFKHRKKNTNPLFHIPSYVAC